MVISEAEHTLKCQTPLITKIHQPMMTIPTQLKMEAKITTLVLQSPKFFHISYLNQHLQTCLRNTRDLTVTDSQPASQRAINDLQSTTV